ncbi:MliC family protein [Pseudomonas asplenii]|uniref:MliC family protein n=1 Tax=Pseudomonas asplenii TaxID=53407 RepID=UPI002234D193|nr:MliC family protein [Pseudomonas asplenii]UZE28743.1 MliC family protein [Pseudomonas asplenii]
MKGFIALASLALLGGCAAFNLPSSTSAKDNWTRWVCDSQTEVFWRYADRSQQSVDVRIGGADQVYRLKPEVGAVDSGVLYSDNMLAFHKKGDEGLVYWVATNDLIGRACKAP